MRPNIKQNLTIHMHRLNKSLPRKTRHRRTKKHLKHPHRCGELSLRHHNQVQSLKRFLRSEKLTQTQTEWLVSNNCNFEMGFTEHGWPTTRRHDPARQANLVPPLKSHLTKRHVFTFQRKEDRVNPSQL